MLLWRILLTGAACAASLPASAGESDGFERAQQAVKTLKKLSNENLLRLYAHYKQATVGPARGTRPGVFDAVARAKFDAWSKLGAMSAESAKTAYCGLVDEFVPGWRQCPTTNS